MNKFLILIVFTIFASCTNDEEITLYKPQLINITTISKGFLSATGNVTTQNTVITNEQEWNITKIALINSGIQATTNPIFSESEINFILYNVILLVDETRPNTKYKLNIMSVIENETSINIKKLVALSTTGNTISNKPYIIIKIPKSEKEFVFE